jgi:hypothetical protein
MAKHNAANARMKREYFQYLKEAGRRSEASIDAVAKALDRFEQANGHKVFASSTANKPSRSSASSMPNAPCAPASRQTRHRQFHAFGPAHVLCLAGGAFGVTNPACAMAMPTISICPIPTCALPGRAPQAVPDSGASPPRSVHHALRHRHRKRNRALVAFALLTGARDGALASFLETRRSARRPRRSGRRDVRTKANKTFSTWFFPVGGQARWKSCATGARTCTVLLWETKTRCFPPPTLPLAKAADSWPQACAATGGPTPGRSARFSPMPLRRRAPLFQPAFLPRHLVQLGERVCPNIEAFKAWSQNLGHARAMTT